MTASERVNHLKRRRLGRLESSTQKQCLCPMRQGLRMLLKPSHLRIQRTSSPARERSGEAKERRLQQRRLPARAPNPQPARRQPHIRHCLHQRWHPARPPAVPSVRWERPSRRAGGEGPLGAHSGPSGGGGGAQEGVAACRTGDPARGPRIALRGAAALRSSIWGQLTRNRYGGGCLCGAAAADDAREGPAPDSRSQTAKLSMRKVTKPFVPGCHARLQATAAARMRAQPPSVAFPERGRTRRERTVNQRADRQAPRRRQVCLRHSKSEFMQLQWLTMTPM